MIEGVIYRYKSPSGKYYIGQTINEERRRRNFFNINKIYGGPKIEKARKKYGPENFEYTVLMKVAGDDPEEVKQYLNTLEIGFIRMYDSFKNGYNMCEGGSSNVGYHHSEEAKKRIGKAHKGKIISEETRQKQRISAKERYIKYNQKERLILSHLGKPAPNRGKHFTKDIKKKIGDANRGRHRVYNPDGTWIMTNDPDPIIPLW